MTKPFLLLLAAVAAWVLPVSVAAPAEPDYRVRARDSAAAGASWISSKQTTTGAFFDDNASVVAQNGVAESLTAVIAGGETGPIPHALDYMLVRAPSEANRGAYAARVIIALVAAGANPRDFGGHDYVARIHADKQRSGAYDSGNVYGAALAALGLLQAGEPLSEDAVRYFRINECPGGGFSANSPCIGQPSIDTTALVLSVLLRQRIPESDATISKARSFLATASNQDGGFGDAKGNQTSANSTGLVLRALADFGESPAAEPWKRSTGANPQSALITLQDSSGGFKSTRSGSSVDAYATIQAVIGIAAHAAPWGAADQSAVEANRASAGESGEQASISEPAAELPENSEATSAVRRGSSAGSPKVGRVPPEVNSPGAASIVSAVVTLLLVAGAYLIGKKVVRR